MAATLVNPIFFMILFKIPFYSTFTFPKTIYSGLLASHLDSSELYESILAIISSPVAIFNYKICSSKPNIRRSITRWSKHGLLFIQAPELDFPIDLTICGDIESNPGEMALQSTKRTQAQNQAIYLNHHVNCRSERIVYSSDQLLSIRVYASAIPLELKTCLKSLRIAKLTRGIRAGKKVKKRQFKTNQPILTRVSLRSIDYAKYSRRSIDRSVLISIPLQPPHKSVHHRQLLSNFALINSRSIRNKTLMLKDYIIERDLDILAITETWLHDDDFDVFFCRDTCSVGFRFYHDPRTTSEGGGVALLVRNQFKLCKQQLADYKSFEAFEAVLKSSGNHNLRLVIIYRPPPSTSNGLSVKLFLEEFSVYLEHLALAPGYYLLEILISTLISLTTQMLGVFYVFWTHLT